MQFCTNCGAKLADGSKFCTVKNAPTQQQGRSVQLIHSFGSDNSRIAF